jgi:hypothetical protein
MARRDWYFAPIPMEMVKVIDEIFDKEGRRLGLDNRQNTIRAMLGDFIELYDCCGQSLTRTRKMIHDLQSNNNNESNNNPSTSPRLCFKS